MRPRHYARDETEPLGAGRLRAAAVASVAGGLTWLAIWAMFVALHGPETHDEQRTWRGWSHYDVGKSIVLPLLLFMAGLAGLRELFPHRPGWMARWGLAVAFLGLSATAVGAALALWPIVWGSYDVDWEDGLARYGGVMIAGGTLVWFFGAVLAAIALVRRGFALRWLAAPLVIGPVAAFPWLHMTTWAGLTGAAWIAIGLALWRR